MSEDFLKNPLSLFDVKGKTAIVTGATGAFGAVAAKMLAAAGASVVLTANNAEGLKKIAAECGKLGGKTEVLAIARVPRRIAMPSSPPRSKNSAASTSWSWRRARTKCRRSSIRRPKIFST